ncbi:MAG TPA: polysaccharide lyase [Azospirillaceae bacterium]|nr:polysaccharide lyase [Azospirillaceae bacterium]
MAWKRTATLLAALAALPIAGYAAYGLGYAWYNAPSDDDLPFTADFETGNLDQWRWSGAMQLCCGHSAQVVADTARDGRHAVRMTLRRDDPLMRGSKRAEFRLPSNTFGETYRYAFSVFIPVDWQPDHNGVLLAQWHNVPDIIFGEDAVPPPLRLYVKGDRMSVEVRWDAHPLSRHPLRDEQTDGFAVVWVGPLETGRWIDWSFDVRWSWGDDGLLEVSKDGTVIVERHGPNAYHDLIAPYFKMGVYVPVWADENRPAEMTSRTVFFDAVDVRRLK